LLTVFQLFLDKDEVLIFIPSTKTASKGEFIDLFPLRGHPCCPVAALKKLQSMQEQTSKYEKDLPVFTFESGNFLTTSLLNRVLKDLLRDVCPERSNISCHSFRAVLATALGSCPDKILVSEIKEWSKLRRGKASCYTVGLIGTIGEYCSSSS
jgi:hypothetical protein